MNSESSLTLPSSSSDILPPSFGISSDSSDKVLSPANIAELNPAAVPPLPPTDYDLLQAAAKNANFGQTNGIDQHISSVEVQIFVEIQKDTKTDRLQFRAI